MKMSEQRAQISCPAEIHDWNGAVCRRCGAVKPHEHVWVYAYTDYDESACETCDKQKAGGVEDWCGDFCFGPGMCSAVRKIDMERCNLCGKLRERL
jgi:hypothetical protein